MTGVVFGGLLCLLLLRSSVVLFCLKINGHLGGSDDVFFFFFFQRSSRCSDIVAQ